ncbi:MAG: hypothetical protein VX951_01470 [Planctomycetota bacterium]|nr:hypothetical protein [Planctomycetota bacterium]
MKTRLLSITALLTTSIFCPTTTAQEVVGITATSPILLRQDLSSANCAMKKCAPASFEKQVARHAGGSAYDSRRRGVWNTNGSLLANIDPYTGKCDYICKPQPIPFPPDPSVRHYATGLAYVDSGARQSSNKVPPGWLFVSYNSNYIARLNVLRCSVDGKFCKLQLPRGSVIAGLATDDVGRRLYIGVVQANNTNLILVTDLDGSWCNPICKSIPPGCNPNLPMGPLTGLAFDSCSHSLIITDGKLTTRYAISAGGCTLRPLGCCPNTADPFTGLCLLPNTDIHSVGNSCSTKACESCPTMRAELLGDPVLGNPYFGLGLREAPNKASTAILAIGLGACSSPGINLGFCTNILVPFPPILNFFPLSPITTPGCNRSVSVPYSVPLNPNLCGLRASFQWLVICKGKPMGIGVTNCVDFMFAGS